MSETTTTERVTWHVQRKLPSGDWYSWVMCETEERAWFRLDEGRATYSDSKTRVVRVVTTTVTQVVERC